MMIGFRYKGATNRLSKYDHEMATRIRKSISPMRKQPRQSRSSALVHAIVEAATRILDTHGWDEFTTNAVADTAGVSIGSLYQYFPDKYALIEAIRRNHLDECMAATRKASQAGKPLRAVVEALVDDMIAAHAKYPRLHGMLLDELPADESTRNPANPFEMAYLACYEAIAAAHGAGPSARTVGIIVSDVIDGVIHNAVRRGTLGTPETRAELVDVVVRYLTVAKGG